MDVCVRSVLVKKQPQCRPIEHKWLNEVSRCLENAANITSDGTIQIIEDQTGRNLRSGKTAYFYARITGGAGPYSWTEVTPASGGTWVTTPGGRSGTTTDNPAYEVNHKSVPASKVVRLYDGVFGEMLFEYVVHGSVCIDARIVVTPSYCGSALTGATIELLDSTGATLLQTGTGGTVTFYADGTLCYIVRISKSGITTYSTDPFCPGCNTITNIEPDLGPDNFDVTFHATICGCDMAGVDVTVTGDTGSWSGTTDGSGNVTINVGKGPSPTESFTYDVDWPSGHGVEPTGSGTIGVVNPCIPPSTISIGGNPASGYTSVCCRDSYMPEVLDLVDDYGFCEISWQIDPAGWVFGPAIPDAWYGQYTYTSNHAIKYLPCGTVLGDYGYWRDQTCDVTVYFRMTRDESLSGGLPVSNCDHAYFKIERRLRLGEGSDLTTLPGGCFPITPTCYCQPVCDGEAPAGLGPGVTIFSDGPTEFTCDSSLVFNWTITPADDGECGECVETGVDIEVTGTIA